MADLEQSLAELESVKQAFKSNITSKGVSTSNVEFRNMPALMNQMEKILPSQTKTVNPTTSEQSVSADSGYKLIGVKVNAVKPSDYYKPEEIANVTPTTSDQEINPTNGAVFRKINVSAVTSAIDPNLKPDIIKKGEVVLGLTGTYEGSGESSKFSEFVDGSLTSIEEADLANVTTIRPYAFNGVESLITVAIPGNVKVIGEGAFGFCVNMQSLSLAEGIEEIGKEAFAYTSVPITLPSTLKTVGSGAFAKNTALTSITIPSGISYVQSLLFLDCTNLTEVTMEATTPPTLGVNVFPDNVVSIYVPYSSYDDYVSSWSDYADINKIVRLPAKPSTITVTVNNYLGELVSGASVTITGNDQTYTGTTDSFGVFSQGDLQPATYTVSVADLEGFKTPDVQEVVVEEDTQNSVMFTYLEETRYVITFPSGVTVKNGNVQLTSGDSVLYGTNLTIGYTLSEHHHLTEFKVNGVDAVNNSTITITSDTTITFTQAIDTYSVTFGAGVSVLNGGVSLTSGDVVPYGTSLVVGYTLTEGYKLTSFQVNGVDTENNATITVTSNIEITFAEEKESSGGGDVAFSRTFSENSPAVISQIGTEISNAGMTSAEVESTYGWKIGDTTSYTLSTGENVEMRIIGFNHDDLSDGSGKKAGITLDMTHCLATKYPFNDTETNAGGYGASVMRTTTLQTIKSTIPQEWRNVIVGVDKKSANGGNSNYTETLTISEDLFLLSEKELYGGITYAQDGTNEGSVYEYWNGKTNSQRVKGRTCMWWLRSSFKDDVKSFCLVSDGSAQSAVWHGSPSGDFATRMRFVSYAFCVGGGSSSGGDTPDTPSFSRTFSENTPAQISAVSAEISANNMTSAQVEETFGWKIGDTTTIALSTGENIEMRIIGFNHDDKSDGSGKAGITLQTVEVPKTLRRMNISDTNAGGYPASPMKTSYFPIIKETLPQEWQDVIKLVDKKSANGGGSNYSQTLTTSDDLFFLSAKEVFGNASNVKDGENEGDWYEYYETHNKANDRVKKYDKDTDGVPETAIQWWLRSSPSSSTSQFSIVGTYGSYGSAVTSKLYGVAFCFCV